MRPGTFVLLVVLAIPVLPVHLFAQSEALERYQKDTIFLDMSWWRTRYVQAVQDAIEDAKGY